MESRARLLRILGLTGVALALLCIPPVAGLVLALSPLHELDMLPLWLLSGVLLLPSVWIAWGRPSRWRSRIAASMLPVLLLVGVDMAAHVVARLLPTNARNELVVLASRTYPDTMAYQSHPFLQFTGRPDSALVGNEALGDLLPFNELGFLGPLPSITKTRGNLRVACLGGSTTVRGYPQDMRGWLQPQMPAASTAEVLNFGMGWYSSTHSVVNFVLNVTDYTPDYVVFHHGWNDRESRDRGVIRGDYLHAFHPFRYPTIRDAWLIRGSVVYRWVKNLLRPKPAYAYLDKAVVRPRPRLDGAAFQDLSELAPFRRNVRTIVDLALARGMVPVLTTQPHSTDPAIAAATHATHMDQCNTIVREEAARYGDRILFVDLDRQVTGLHNEFFVDVGHMDGIGNAFKARTIGEVILRHWRARPASGR